MQKIQEIDKTVSKKMKFYAEMGQFSKVGKMFG